MGMLIENDWFLFNFLKSKTMSYTEPCQEKKEQYLRYVYPKYHLSMKITSTLS